MKQKITDEQRIAGSFARKDIGWPRFAWLLGHAMFYFVAAFESFIWASFVMFVVICSTSRRWAKLKGNRKELDRYYLKSGIIAVLVSLLIIFQRFR